MLKPIFRFLIYAGIVVMVAPDLVGNVIHSLGDSIGMIIEGSTEVAVDKAKDSVQKHAEDKWHQFVDYISPFK